MAVGKRLRFEVLRRDNHTCRYCGRSAPEVKLTVDHVIPEALGGQDVAENLVTACEDCNSGKTSIAPGSPLVDDVKQDAVRWSRALQEAARIRRQDRWRRLEFGDRFVEMWENFQYGPEGDQLPVPLDVDWRTSVENFFAAGLDLEDLEYATRLAMGNRKVLIDDMFRYFCGICWRIVGELHETAQQIVEMAPVEAPPPATRPEATEASEASRALAREIAARAKSHARKVRGKGLAGN